MYARLSHGSVFLPSNEVIVNSSDEMERRGDEQEWYVVSKELSLSDFLPIPEYVVFKSSRGEDIPGRFNGPCQVSLYPLIQQSERLPGPGFEGIYNFRQSVGFWQNTVSICQFIDEFDEFV